MMTAAEIRLKQNPILTSLLLGMAQGEKIAEKLFPRLPQALSSVQLVKLGDERFRRYNLRRAPGSATKRIEIQFEGVTYKVDQYSVEVPIPRELLREDYELEVAGLATTAGTYDAGHVTALAAGTKWSAATGTPVTDIRAAANVIRKKIGKRPNTLMLSADAKVAVETNPEVKGYLPNTQMGVPTLDQLKKIFEVDEIIVGEAVWKNNAGVGADVWGNNAVLAYVPKIGGNTADISLAEPGFGFTNVLEGHPFSETPYYSNDLKSWIYGATFERRPNVAYNTAAWLFQNPK
jgi:hypothetical protein